MSILTAGTITITAPTAVDGLGEVAVLNHTAAAGVTYVGRLLKPSGFGGAAVRTSMDSLPQAHGATFGTFYYAHRSFTLEVLLAKAATWALSDARYNKLCRAFNAMAADGSIVWPDNDGYTKLISFRQEQPPSDPDENGRVLLAAVAEDPRIYNNTPQTGSSPKTNNGNAGSPPTFTLTPTANGTVVITNTTAGLGSPAVTLIVGTGYVTTGTAVTVDFGARTITQGGTLKPQAEVFPTSLWWEVVPGANTWTVSNASSVSISFRDSWLSA